MSYLEDLKRRGAEIAKRALEGSCSSPAPPTPPENYIRVRPLQPGAPWTKAADCDLAYLLRAGKRIEEISVRMGRTCVSIRSRAKKLGLIKTAPKPSIKGKGKDCDRG